MSPELAKALERDFPDQFATIRDYCECSDGWEPLIRRACTELEPYKPVWGCIKEKFGGLRLYADNALPGEAHDLIGRFEAESYRTCEDCGQPGELRQTSWIRTLCDKHYGGANDD